jgi:hypothetical protein
VTPPPAARNSSQDLPVNRSSQKVGATVFAPCRSRRCAVLNLHLKRPNHHGSAEGCPDGCRDAPLGARRRRRPYRTLPPAGRGCWTALGRGCPQPTAAATEQPGSAPVPLPPPAVKNPTGRPAPVLERFGGSPRRPATRLLKEARHQVAQGVACQPSSAHSRGKRRRSSTGSSKSHACPSGVGGWHIASAAPGARAGSCSPVTAR